MFSSERLAYMHSDVSPEKLAGSRPAEKLDPRETAGIRDAGAGERRCIAADGGGVKRHRGDELLGTAAQHAGRRGSRGGQRPR
jgi:hypothetical protein